MRHRSYLLSLGLAALFLWNGAGESSDPRLAKAQLPPEILHDCAAVAVSASNTSCGNVDYRIRWVGRSSAGDLFLVEHSVCTSDDCRAWLVTKDRTAAARMLIALTGQVRLEFDRGAFPIIHTRLELAGSYTSYNRFAWSGEEYARIETRLVHRVDGFECADEVECDVAAREALDRDRTDRALRIWQQVHGVNWI